MDKAAAKAQQMQDYLNHENEKHTTDDGDMVSFGLHKYRDNS